MSRILYWSVAVVQLCSCSIYSSQIGYESDEMKKKIVTQWVDDTQIKKSHGCSCDEIKYWFIAQNANKLSEFILKIKCCYAHTYTRMHSDTLTHTNSSPLTFFSASLVWCGFDCTIRDQIRLLKKKKMNAINIVFFFLILNFKKVINTTNRCTCLCRNQNKNCTRFKRINVYMMPIVRHIDDANVFVFLY